MNETILIARNRKTGKDAILLGRDASFSEQKAAYKEFSGGVHNEFDRVALVNVIPAKKPLKLITQDEHEARITAHAEQVKAEATDEAEKPAHKKKGKK
jgi:hypothetical protein